MTEKEVLFSFCSTIMAFSQCVDPQDVKGQCWTDEESDGENESEQFLYGIQVQKRLLPFLNLYVDSGVVRVLKLCFRH